MIRIKFHIRFCTNPPHYPHGAAGLFHRVSAACKNRISIAFDSHFRHLWRASSPNGDTACKSRICQLQDLRVPDLQADVRMLSRWITRYRATAAAAGELAALSLALQLFLVTFSSAQPWPPGPGAPPAPQVTPG